MTAHRRGSALWTRPSRAEKAPAMPDEWDIASGGWTFHGKRKTAFLRGAMMVGDDYLAVQTYTTCLSEHGEWAGIVFLPLRNDVVTWPEADLGKPGRGVAALVGKSVSEVAARLGPQRQIRAPRST